MVYSLRSVICHLSCKSYFQHVGMYPFSKKLLNSIEIDRKKGIVQDKWCHI